MPSQTDIINMALDLLEEEPMLDPDDDRAPIRWMKRNLQPAIDGMLRLHPWNFAVRRKALSAETGAPVSGWKRQYVLPPDCLRVLPLNDGTLLGRSVPYALEGRRILTNAEAPIQIVYVGRPDDATVLDALFVQALAATLASRAANWITGKQSYAQALRQQAQELILQAQMVDALEGTPADPEADDFVMGRFTGPVDSTGAWG